MVVCSGKMETCVKKDGKWSWTFNVDRQVCPAHLGIIVGKLKAYSFNKFARKVYAPAGFKMASADEILLWLKSKESLLLEMEDSTEMVLIPGLIRFNLISLHKNYGMNSLQPFYFYDFFAVCAEFFLDERHIEFRVFAAAEFLRYKFLSQLVERMVPGDVSAIWIFHGAASFFEDLMIGNLHSFAEFPQNFYRKKTKYFQQIEDGLDSNPLAAPLFATPDEAAACPTFNLKANLLFFLISAHLKLSKETFYTFFNIFKSQAVLTSGAFFSLIKEVYKLKHFKKKLKMFVETSGTVTLDFKYVFNLKDNKLLIHLTQIPIAQVYFAAANQRRQEVEEFYKLQSQPFALRANLTNQLHDILARNGQLFLKRPQDSAPPILVANEARQTLKILDANIHYTITEASNEDYTEEVGDINLKEREIEIKENFRGKINRITNTKKASEPENLQEEELTQNHPNLSLNDVEIHSSINKDTNEYFSRRATLDPYNTFLF